MLGNGSKYAFHPNSLSPTLFLVKTICSLMPNKREGLNTLSELIERCGGVLRDAWARPGETLHRHFESIFGSLSDLVLVLMGDMLY